MTKIERLRATLAGQAVDRPPFTVWYHFGNQHSRPERTAEIHLEFFEAYDLDLLKVMNDYDYPNPEGVETIETPEDLQRIAPFDVLKTPMGNQLRAIEIIAKALRGKALFLDTVFNAWNTLRRNLAKENLKPLMEKHPQEVLAALRVINGNLIQYAKATLERGAAGIFFSVPASAEFITREQYETFMRPLDLELLRAVAGKGECHVLHAHGEKLYIDRLLDYPVQVISWADLSGGPSISEMRKKTSLTLMAGIDHVRFVNVSARVIREQIQAAKAQAGPTKFILAPGCSLPTFSYPPMIRAAREAARK
jgi:uroporphyrinogen decarboxylase